MKSYFKKVIYLFLISALLLCFGTSLHATQDKRYWQKHQNHNWSGNNSWKKRISWFDDDNNGRWKRGKEHRFGYKEKPPGCNAPEQ
jgi:hypothetical protein